MRILVVSQYFWPEDFRVNDLVDELVKRGHSVTVLTSVPNYPTGKLFKNYKHNPNEYNTYRGASIVRIPVVPRGTGSIQLVLNYLTFVCSGLTVGAWKLRNRNYDIVFCFQPSPVTVGLPAVFLSKLKKVPLVFWVLDLWPDTLVALGAVRSFLLLKLIECMVRYIYDNCALVLGQSQSFLESISKHCTIKDKIRFFPSWSEDLFAIDSCVPAPEIEQIHNGFTVVFAGNIGEAQDMPGVLEAVECLKANKYIRWIFVGDGRKYNWLQEQVIQRGLSNNVLLLGRFPIERMPSFYAHADALLVSLRREPVFSMTIPGKVQSYLAAGIPILGMLDGEGARVIRDSNAGFVCEAGDGVGLARAVLTLAGMSQSERNQLGINGCRYASKEFSRVRLMDHLEDLLSRTIIAHKY